MLAKLWKKVLLAVCIIACIFNVMTKLVNRTSLETNLKSVDDGTVVFNLFEKKEENTVNSYITDSKNNNENATAPEQDSKEIINNEPEPTPVEEKQEEKNGGYKYTDFVIEF